MFVMNERYNKALGYEDSQINREARELLGNRRLEHLGVFSNEDHLQRTLDTFRNNPNSIAAIESLIGGGNALLRERRSVLEAQLYDDDDPDRAVRISILNDFFRVGFGVVEHTVVSHRITQGENEVLEPEAYMRWAAGTPQAERVEEMKAYLSSQEADMLARNFFDGDEEGTMMRFMHGLTVSSPRVNGEAPYVMSVNQDTEARNQLTEGVLAAMYLLREHQIGQEMRDAAEILEPSDDTPLPPETPPGYYLG